MTNRDKAENLWQALNAVLLQMKINKVADESYIDEVQNVLKENRPTETNEDALFAKKVLDELPLESRIALISRIKRMCEVELNIIN